MDTVAELRLVNRRLFSSIPVDLLTVSEFIVSVILTNSCN